ncbi:AtpZ/AtpI family protein [Paenibacillus sp. TRM 82003]|nr:AtpZ/AtpI family protein [Paenibacillus sp. TRM 82003]MCI3923473.1 AtpZ/AtpI family protein [Paenibacillus sp. TRM 82003]
MNAIGIDFGVCVVAGYFAGDFLQSKFGGPLWLLLGLFIGISAGVWSAALIIKRFIGA